jgi:hypothetical protein
LDDFAGNLIFIVRRRFAQLPSFYGPFEALLIKIAFQIDIKDPMRPKTRHRPKKLSHKINHNDKK